MDSLIVHNLSLSGLPAPVFKTTYIVLYVYYKQLAKFKMQIAI